MAEQKKLDFELTATTHLPASILPELDDWADRHLSDRSKVLRGILLRVLEMVKEVGGFEQAPREIIDRLRLDPA